MDVQNSFTEEGREEILSMKRDPQLYKKMARSVCPSVFGHDEVKRGVLLMLFGGVHKRREGYRCVATSMCVCWRPKHAKSQFLKYVCNFLPRTIYASGRRLVQQA